MTIRRCLSSLKIKWLLAKEIFSFWKLIRRHNASVASEKSSNKMRYSLLRDTHVIEKAMSLRNPRRGFGQQKILGILDKIEVYLKYPENDIEFVKYPLAVIKSYIDYTQTIGVNIHQIEDRYRHLLSKVNGEKISFVSGVTHITRKEIIEQSGKSFESFLYSRHSVRYFTSVVPDREQIERALLMAQQTPSACNRQGWRTHLFFGESSYQLVRWQQGANGFEDEVHCSILVTADLNAFFSHEVHQAYVDGGMYAMTLIHALHSLGLGTIPLSCGVYCDRLYKLKELFAIPDNEVPILIIGTGNMEDSFRVAVSARKEVSETNTYH